MRLTKVFGDDETYEEGCEGSLVLIDEDCEHPLAKACLDCEHDKVYKHLLEEHRKNKIEGVKVFTMSEVLASFAVLRGSPDEREILLAMR